MKHARILTLVFLLPSALIAAEPARPVDVSKIPLPVPRKVDFTQEVYPMLKESCFSCHGAQKQKGKYRCDTKDGAFKDTDHGPTIVPGHSEKSSLVHMVCVRRSRCASCRTMFDRRRSCAMAQKKLV